jgi:hypothetical protein
MRARTATVFVAAFLTTAGGQAQHVTKESLKDKPKVRAHQVSGQRQGVGTVQYDPGAPADAFGLAPYPLNYFGNRFDTSNGNPLSFPGTVTGVSWYQGLLGYYGPIAIAIAGPPATSLSLTAVATSVAPNAFNSVGVSWPFGGAFIAGLVNPASPAGGAGGYFGSLGLRSASTNAQGFHGIQRNWSGAVSNALPGQNAMVRVSGNVVIPVELLEFEVE